MKNIIELGASKFLAGYNCAQAVLYSFCDDIHLEKETALKLACGFGAGMGRKQEVCGALTGGIIAIGAKYGRGEKAEKIATEVTYEKVRELLDRFSERHGTFICRKLLGGCELMTEDGRKYLKENDLVNKICLPCVKSAIEIVAKVMELT